MASATPEQAPTRIGKYRILCHLKSGGMAAVYKAEDPDSGRTVALKVLTDESANQPKRLERFRREAKQALGSGTRTSWRCTSLARRMAGCSWRRIRGRR